MRPPFTRRVWREPSRAIPMPLAVTPLGSGGVGIAAAGAAMAHTTPAARASPANAERIRWGGRVVPEIVMIFLRKGGVGVGPAA
ncbi:hypothetical protein Afil01_21850 [Actinorhabdospora filicis]|uniref:Uncharacterized protein n=1 Tax=Actinorhabdospora filicis TaxID=1785913 RepID=A0A9W6W8V9_9ACTN|nr:hypothetical protein Afil01_21850 [Actinorhabdospora filicis]